eukprot:jgi/Ulvmu1/12542/UM090_0029.1
MSAFDCFQFLSAAMLACPCACVCLSSRPSCLHGPRWFVMRQYYCVVSSLADASLLLQDLVESALQGSHDVSTCTWTFRIRAAAFQEIRQQAAAEAIISTWMSPELLPALPNATTLSSQEPAAGEHRLGAPHESDEDDAVSFHGPDSQDAAGDGCEEEHVEFAQLGRRASRVSKAEGFQTTTLRKRAQNTLRRPGCCAAGDKPSGATLGTGEAVAAQAGGLASDSVVDESVADGMRVGSGGQASAGDALSAGMEGGGCGMDGSLVDLQAWGGEGESVGDDESWAALELFYAAGDGPARSAKRDGNSGKRVHGKSGKACSVGRGVGVIVAGKVGVGRGGGVAQTGTHAAAMNAHGLEEGANGMDKRGGVGQGPCSLDGSSGGSEAGAGTSRSCDGASRGHRGEEDADDSDATGVSDGDRSEAGHVGDTDGYEGGASGHGHGAKARGASRANEGAGVRQSGVHTHGKRRGHRSVRGDASEASLMYGQFNDAVGSDEEDMPEPAGAQTLVNSEGEPSAQCMREIRGVCVSCDWTGFAHGLVLKFAEAVLKSSMLRNQDHSEVRPRQLLLLNVRNAVPAEICCGSHLLAIGVLYCGRVYCSRGKTAESDCYVCGERSLCDLYRSQPGLQTSQAPVKGQTTT